MTLKLNEFHSFSMNSKGSENKVETKTELHDHVWEGSY